MKIDSVSTKVIQAALYLDDKKPGSVSEIWLDNNLIEKLRSSIPANILSHLEETEEEVDQVIDTRRKVYLRELVHAIEFQLNDNQTSYKDFSQNVFGYHISWIDKGELDQIEHKIQLLEEKLGKSRFEFFEQNKLASGDYELNFKKAIELTKQKLPEYILDFEDNGFIFETASKQPWTAFNTHIAPFISKLTLNTDIEFNQYDLLRLAYHESYGGHHSELSHKDALLLHEGRGEHGLVLTFSPQAFISEAIAEGVYYVLNLIDKEDPMQMLSWYYDRLIFGLQNIATHMYLDGKPKDWIANAVSKYGLTQKSVDAVVNFSTDPIYTRYAPIYYSSFDFLIDIYSITNDKEKLIKTLFTQPCTVSLLEEEFGVESNPT